jgi:hypothetical protein
MLLCGVTSIDTWVAQMRAEPFYAIHSGFALTQVPGVGTFYDFIDRLLRLDAQHVKHLYRPKPRQQRAKRDKQASKDKNKDIPTNQHIVAKLAARLLRRTTPTWHCDPAKFARAEQVIQAIFYACVVTKSVALGLIDLQHLCVSGDGSKFRTWANPNGRKHRKCDNKGKKPEEWCGCERYYRDPARSGYDSDHELTAYALDSTVELPLFLLLADNNRHDSALGLFAMDQARDNLGLPIQVASFDKASDALGFYQLGYEQWHTKLVIPPNERNAGHFTFAPRGPLTPEGTPLCAAGRPMSYRGYCPDRQRLKWRCPLIAGTQTERQKPCACQDLCSPSAYGRVVYTYPKTNYRLFTPIPRDSA